MVLKRLLRRFAPGLSETQLKARIKSGEAAAGVRAPAGGISGFGGAAPKPLPKVLPKLKEKETPAVAREKKFSINGKKVSKEKFEEEKQKLKFIAEGGRKAITPEEAEAIKSGQQAVTGEAAPLKEELLRDIIDQPSLEPDPALETISAFGLLPAVKIGNMITGLLETLTGEDFGETTVEELAQTPAGKALGLATLGVAGTLAAITANPILAQITARSATASSMVAKIGALNGITKSPAAPCSVPGVVSSFSFPLISCSSIFFTSFHNIKMIINTIDIPVIVASTHVINQIVQLSS